MKNWILIKFLREITDKRLQHFFHILSTTICTGCGSHLLHILITRLIVTSSFKQMLKVVRFGQYRSVNDNINLLKLTQMLA